MNKLIEKRAELAQKQKALAAIFEAAGPELDLSKVEALKGYADTAAKAAEIKRLNDEMSGLGMEVEGLVALEGIASSTKRLGDSLATATTTMQHPGGQSQTATARPVKSLGELFIESKMYQEGKQDSRPRFGVQLPDFDVKTLLQTTAGWAPAPPMTSKLVPYANRRPLVASVIPSDMTTATAVRYMEETTFTNAAASVAEGGLKPESALAFTERTIPIEVIATWIPVTRQQLDDVPAIQGIIDNRLTLMLMLAEEVELLTGTGVTPHLLGFLVKTGVQTQAKGADSVPDAIYKAMVLVRNTGMADPTAIILHPNDWQDVRLLKTADGIYIWGSPAEPSGVDRIWGLPVIQTTAETEGTGLLGDFQLYSHISRKMGIQIDVSDSHSDYFIYNKLAIRAEERLSLEIYRAAAFCKITGV